MVSPPSRDGRSLHNRRAVKMNLANEGLEARKKEEEVNAKKRKAEEDAQWEGEHVVHLCFVPYLTPRPANREQRVGSWRNFTANSKKKKKTKVALLG